MYGIYMGHIYIYMQWFRGGRNGRLKGVSGSREQSTEGLKGECSAGSASACARLALACRALPSLAVVYLCVPLLRVAALSATQC